MKNRVRSRDDKQKQDARLQRSIHNEAMDGLRSNANHANWLVSSSLDSWRLDEISIVESCFICFRQEQ